MMSPFAYRAIVDLVLAVGQLRAGRKVLDRYYIY
jgi:hypothetical protein